MRILIVDDEPLVAHTLTLIFQRSGFVVDTAHTAAEGLTTALACHPDLVLCDIDMPGRNGLDLMQDLSRELPGTPILVLTGYYHGLAHVRDTALHMPQRVNIVTKPCQPAELLREADTLLRCA